MPRQLTILTGLLLVSCIAFSQTELKGIIRSEQTELPIENVTVRNLASKKVAISGRDGRYIIQANEDDTIIFSITAYVPDTLRVSYGLLLTTYDPNLQMNTVALRGVTVRTSYQLDSLNRSEDYKQLKGSMRNITGNNRPTDGVGVSLSPLSYFSQRAKRQRIAKRRMESTEEELYVDDRFSSFTVSRLTKLSGDSLNLFMYMYRPSYKQARKLDRDDMIEYISEKLILFRQRKPAAPVADSTNREAPMN